VKRMKTTAETLRKLNNDQLVGAEFAVRYLATWPGFRGEALKVLRDFHADANAEMERRNGEQDVATALAPAPGGAP
jgi:hypothetical protein